jgi:hypothetical protein
VASSKAQFIKAQCIKQKGIMTGMISFVLQPFATDGSGLHHAVKYAIKF